MTSSLNLWLLHCPRGSCTCPPLLLDVFSSYLLVSLAAGSIVSITEFCFYGTFYVECGNICAILRVSVCVSLCTHILVLFFFFSFQSTLIYSVCPHSWQKHQWTTSTNPITISGAVMDQRTPGLHRSFSMLLLCLQNLSSDLGGHSWLSSCVNRIAYILNQCKAF